MMKAEWKLLKRGAIANTLPAAQNKRTDFTTIGDRKAVTKTSEETRVTIFWTHNTTFW